MHTMRFVWTAGILATVGLLLSSCAGSSDYMRPSTSTLAPTSDKALVRFMRPSPVGPNVEFTLLDSNKLIGNIAAKSQFDYLADPGPHVFIATAQNKVFLEADLAPGKVYYVITRIYYGVGRFRVAFIAVTRGSEYWETVHQYEKELQRFEPDEAKLKAWEAQNKAQIDASRAADDTEFKAKYDWPKLVPGDGR